LIRTKYRGEQDYLYTTTAAFLFRIIIGSGLFFGFGLRGDLSYCERSVESIFLIMKTGVQQWISKIQES
jgi:hypothetical protein